MARALEDSRVRDSIAPIAGNPVGLRVFPHGKIWIARVGMLA